MAAESEALAGLSRAAVLGRAALARGVVPYASEVTAAATGLSDSAEEVSDDPRELLGAVEHHVGCWK